MTDRREDATDHIDAGWDDSDPSPSQTPASLSPGSDSLATRRSSITSTPPTDEIDEAWDLPSATDPDDSTRQVAKQILGKRERRQLKREARARQAARTKENRSQRKAERSQQAKQKEPEPKRHPTEPASAQLDPPAKRPKTARRAKQAKIVKQTPAPPTVPLPASVPANATPSGAQLNRAQRRAKGGAVAAALPSTNLAASLATSKKRQSGAFALFFGAVILLSVLSYFVLR